MHQYAPIIAWLLTFVVILALLRAGRAGWFASATVALIAGWAALLALLPCWDIASYQASCFVTGARGAEPHLDTLFWFTAFVGLATFTIALLYILRSAYRETQEKKKLASH